MVLVIFLKEIFHKQYPVMLVEYKSFGIFISSQKGKEKKKHLFLWNYYILVLIIGKHFRQDSSYSQNWILGILRENTSLVGLVLAFLLARLLLLERGKERKRKSMLIIWRKCDRRRVIVFFFPTKSLIILFCIEGLFWKQYLLLHYAGPQHHRWMLVTWK